MNLIPVPERIEPRTGSFSIARARVKLLDDTEETRALAREYGGDGRDPADGDPVIAIGFRDDGSLGTEGYELTIAPEGVELRAPRPAGLFHGLQTLGQLREEAAEIPAARIVDRPRFRWRGLHLDVSRHFFPVPFVKRMIDLAAEHKLNTFHWHLTDDQGWRLAIENRPRLAEVAAWRTEDDRRVGGLYSRDDVREVLDHAASRYVTVVPEIEMPGHAMAALTAYPELSCTGGPFEVPTTSGIFDDVYCAGNDETFAFLEAVLTEVIDLFPGPYVHIGGDECPKTRWRACPRCQERMKSEGLASEDELQSWFVRRMSRWLAERDRRLVGWDEILEGGLAPGATVMSWQGFEGGIAAARAGHDVVMTPTAHCYFDYQQRDHPDEPGAIGITPLEQVYAFEPVPAELTADEARHVLGAQANVWTERMVNEERVEYMVLPRLCALAEVAWSIPSRRDWRDFRERLPSHLARLERLGYRPRPLDE